jgi:hypothetical protein
MYLLKPDRNAQNWILNKSSLNDGSKRAKLKVPARREDRDVLMDAIIQQGKKINEC